MTVWFCCPMEMPPQDWAALWQQAGMALPPVGAGVEALGGATDPGPSQAGVSGGEVGSPQITVGQKRCWGGAGSVFPPPPLDFGAVRKSVPPTNLSKTPTCGA